MTVPTPQTTNSENFLTFARPEPPEPPMTAVVEAPTPHNVSPQVAAPPVVAAWPVPTVTQQSIAAPLPEPVGAPQSGVMASTTSTSVVVHNSVRPFKSPGIAALLALFFGPLGMLYATIPGAAVIFAANLVIAIITFITFGLGAFLWFGTWIAGVVWAVVASNQHNQQAATTTIAVGTGVVA